MDLNGMRNFAQVMPKPSGSHGGVGGVLSSRRSVALMRTGCLRRYLATATGILSESLAVVVFLWFCWCWFGGGRDWV